MDSPELLAIVEVGEDARVRCQAEGCGHPVHKRIHVVRHGDTLQVLGSSCFSKLFGGKGSPTPRYGGSSGRVLTPEERELLLTNTAQLLELFKAEHEAALKALQLAQRRAPRQPPPLSRTQPRPALPTPSVTRFEPTALGGHGQPPWPWMKRLASMGYFKLTDGTGWVRVLRNDGRHVLAPWPSYEGWDEAFGSHLGQVDMECGCYLLRDVVDAVAYLRARCVSEKVCGSRRELDAAASTSACKDFSR